MPGKSGQGALGVVWSEGGLEHRDCSCKRCTYGAVLCGLCCGGEGGLGSPSRTGRVTRNLRRWRPLLGGHREVAEKIFSSILWLKNETSVSISLGGTEIVYSRKLAEPSAKSSYTCIKVIQKTIHF